MIFSVERSGQKMNMHSDASPQEAQDDGIWTVSQLNRRVGALLEGNFSRIWVRGEISNFTQAASGHWYFSVKEEGAAVRAVMFRGRDRKSTRLNSSHY